MKSPRFNGNNSDSSDQAVSYARHSNDASHARSVASSPSRTTVTSRISHPDSDQNINNSDDNNDDVDDNHISSSVSVRQSPVHQDASANGNEDDDIVLMSATSRVQMRGSFLATASASIADVDDPVAIGGNAGSPQQDRCSLLQHETTANWQACVAAATSHLSTITERVASLHNNSHMSDISFELKCDEAGNVVSLSAHRLILSMSSPVFYAMFFGKMKCDDSSVAIEDIELDSFKNLLSYIYTDNVQLESDNVMGTLYAAKKYGVEQLETICVEFLKCVLRPENAFLLLSQAKLFDENQLYMACLDAIDRSANEAFNSEYFLSISHETLLHIVQRNSLAIKESKLFDAVIRWADAESERRGMPSDPNNRRNVLGNSLIHAIRYPLMTLEEFADIVPPSNVLDDYELVQLFLHFTSTRPRPARWPFINLPRNSFLGEEMVVNRFRKVETRWGYSGTSDRLRFFVNRRLFIMALGLYGSIHGPHEYTIYIELLDYDCMTVVATNSLKLKCDGSGFPFRVPFKSPVEILPNVNYVACATLSGPDSYYGTHGLRKVSMSTSNDDDEPIVFHFTYAGGNNNNGTCVEDGQIPQLIFRLPA